MKLIIDIPDEAYNRFLKEQHLPNRLDIEWVIVHGKPLDDELQEIRQEIEKIPTTIKGIGYFNKRDVFAYQIDVLKIIDTHISALNNDQFERIWQNTVEEMRRRKIREDILEEAEEWDSETMSGSLLTDDDLRQLIGDGISRCKEQDKVTQWIKDNADFIKEVARMLEENDRRILCNRESNKTNDS